MRKRLSVHWLFFKSTLPIGLGGALGMCMLSTMVPSAPKPGVLSFILAFFSFLPAGIILDLLYKEVARKKEYYFYYNLSITRIELWVVTLLFSCLLYVLAKTIISQWIPV